MVPASTAILRGVIYIPVVNAHVVAPRMRPTIIVRGAAGNLFLFLHICSFAGRAKPAKIENIQIFSDI